jgi:hypothetical protein
MRKTKTTEQTKKKKAFFKRTGIRILLGVLVLLVALRIALPYIVLKYANKTLSHMHGYYGHVNDIDIALYRGAYKINNIYLHKIDTLSMQESEFFEARQIDLSVHWSALLEGKIVGELELEDPRIKFLKDKVEPKQIKNDTNDFHDLLDNFMPLRVNRFEIINGVVQYIDSTSKPIVNIQMDNMHVKAENLTTEKSDDILPSTVTAEANIYKGHLNLEMRLNPFSKEPTFDLNTELKDTHLPELNDFFKAYGKFDVNKGTFGLYAEVASKEGNFVGYVKPIIKNLDILGAEDRKDNILQKVWEAVVGGAGQLLRNQKHDQIATKVPLEGNFKETKTNVLYAVVEVLRNAFIQALQPTIDQQIGIGTVGQSSMEALEKETGTPPTKEETEKKDEEKKKKGGFLKKLFNKKDKDDSSDEKKDEEQPAEKK